jgi:manganese transport protein
VARVRGAEAETAEDVHGASVAPPMAPARPPRRIAVAVDFSPADAPVLSYAMTVARSRGERPADVVLLHVVESGGARVFPGELDDRETRADEERLALYARRLTDAGVEASYDLGFGEPPQALAALVQEHDVDLVILGSHGHRALGDLVHGTSVERLRHLVRVPVLVVPDGTG